MIIFAPAFRIKEKKKTCCVCFSIGGVGGCFSIWMAFFIHSFTTSSEKKELYERRFTAKSNATTFSIEYIPLTTNRVDQPHKKEEEEEQTPRTSRRKAMTTWSSPRAMVNAASTRTASSSFKSWKSRATTKTTTMTATRRRSVGTTNDDDTDDSTAATATATEPERQQTATRRITCPTWPL